MTRIEELNKAIAEKQQLLNTKISEVRAGADDTETPVADVKAGMEEIKEIKSQIESINEQIKTLSEALELEPAEETKDEPKDDGEVSEEETEKPEPEEQRDEDDVVVDDNSDTQADEVADVVAEDDEEINGADKDKEEKRSGNTEGIENMKTQITNNADAFQAFLAKGEVRDGLTTVDGGVVIPKQILDIQKVPTDPTQLASYVNRVAVSSGMGALPVLAKNTAKLVTAEELAENPEIAKLQLKEVDYKAKTFRGVLPVSMEMLQDAPEIESVVATYVAEAKALTEQAKIGEVLQKATAIEVSDIDGIKDAFNKGLANYNRMFVVTESFFAEIDKMKDADGRYLLQDSITSASGKALLGAPVVIVADDVLGKAGEAHAFVGDVKAFALEALRHEVSIEWQDDDVFSKKLAVALRADFQVADEQAGKFLTLASK